MKLILTKMEKKQKHLWGFEELFKAWLWYHNIFIGELNKDFHLSYNDVYHFYDLELYKILGNPGNPTGHWDKVIQFLTDEDYRLNVEKGSWRWEGKVKIEGIRIWIYPKSLEKFQIYNYKEFENNSKKMLEI